MTDQHLLRVEGLHVGFASARGFAYAVRGIDLQIGHGERVGIVGESSSGKSVTAHTILRLLPDSAKVKGRIQLDGQDLLTMSPREIRAVRGRRIGMIFQDPMTALDPVRTIGSQVVEAARHRGLHRKEARSAAVDMLAELGIPQPSKRFDDYPHHFSGGQRQRIVIAAALIGEPDLLIADEPTTALDVIVQARLMELLLRLSETRHTAVLFISHDLALVGSFAERTIVMYAGKIRETAQSGELFVSPKHPYTAGLMRLVPRLRGAAEQSLQPIPGRPPMVTELRVGCAFAPRCVLASDVCAEKDPLLTSGDGSAHLTACHHSDLVGSLLNGTTVESAAEQVVTLKSS
jgi:oligopeptide/dipeptide ABC transporter ATP-binding protein